MRAEKGPPHESRALGWRNGRFRLADDWGDVILDSDRLTKLKRFFVLDSDWLTKYEGFSCLILIGCRQFFGFGHKLSVFDNVFRLGVGWLTHFRHCETFSRKFFWIFSWAPRCLPYAYGSFPLALPIASAPFRWGSLIIYYACGYWYDL